MLVEEVSLEEVRDGLFEFLDANYGRTLSLSKETDRQINIRSEEFGFFSISPGALSSEGIISETTQRGLWTATDKATGLTVAGVEKIEINGLSVEFEGEPIDGETLVLESRNRPASGIGLAFDNPALIAAAEIFGLSIQKITQVASMQKSTLRKKGMEILDQEIDILLET